MPQFQTSTCPTCSERIDDTVESHELALPGGATLEVRFCSDDHRDAYLANVETRGDHLDYVTGGGDA